MIVIMILLGIVQGICEFLPISSSGHLVLLEKIFDINCNTTFLNVLLHCATLIAVIFYYRKTLWQLLKNPFSKTNFYLLISTLPAIIMVLLFKSIFDHLNTSNIALAVGFFVSAIMILLSTVFSQKNTNALDAKSALLIGIAQGFALMPGLSRSGTTLAGALLCGIDKKSALDYSFLMSIPIIFASIVYEIIFNDFSTAFANIDILGLILSSIFALISAIIGLYIMHKFIKKWNMIYFIPYLILLSILTLIFV